MNKKFHIGILGAMPEEVFLFKENIISPKKMQFGDLEVYSGEWKGSKNRKKKIFISVAWSGWGKVSSSRAVTRLISLNLKGIPKVEMIIFNGVAGAAFDKLKQWDIILPSKLIQYDMDATPLFEKYVIPGLKESYLVTDHRLLSWATSIIETRINKDNKFKFGNVYNGLVATGDTFISEELILDKLKENFPDLMAVEMEGASVAQIAIQESVPFLIIRVISDNAKESAEQKFEEFISLYKNFSWILVSFLLEDFDNAPI